jgi:ADP-ribosylglycohydrolase
MYREVSPFFRCAQGKAKRHIRGEIETRFGYDLGRTTEMIRRTCRFYESCQETVPQAITAFLGAVSYEDIRLAVSLGGDADTLACITGRMAGALYGIPARIAIRALARVDEDLRRTMARFCEKYAMLLP